MGDALDLLLLSPPLSQTHSHQCDDAPTTRMFDRNLAGGGLLDIGIYPLAVASMAFGGSMPSSIKVTCYCLGCRSHVAVAVVSSPIMLLLKTLNFSTEPQDVQWKKKLGEVKSEQGFGGDTRPIFFILYHFF